MNQIKWKRGDVIRLGQAVAKFNRTAKQYGIDRKYSLPEMKKDILSRKELNRQIAKMKRLTPETASTWTINEQKREIKSAIRRLKKELKNTPKGEFMVNSDYGAISGEIENIKRIDQLSPKFKAQKIERVEELARADYELKVAQNYKEWYMQSLDEYFSEFSGYKQLRSKLMGIANPKRFYDKIKIFENESDIHYMRYTNQTQALFNKILEAWGMGEYGEDVEEEVYSGF